MKTKENNISDKSTDTRWAIRPLVPREVYTDRQEHIDYLYNAALDAIGRRTMSTVLFGPEAHGQDRDIQAGGKPSFFRTGSSGSKGACTGLLQF